ncbi:MAG: cysteine--tRNA ligase, partial [Rhodospirillales bacterium]|nr:cysteine--tRNA ligase [Rhodospirillales bacterium]
ALKAAGKFLGLFNVSPEEWFAGGIDEGAIEGLVAQRVLARIAKDFAESDRIRDLLLNEHGVVIEDGPGGTYKIRKA